MAEPVGFRGAHHDWLFTRLENGDVEIRAEGRARGGMSRNATVRMTGHEWESIVRACRYTSRDAQEHGRERAERPWDDGDHDHIDGFPQHEHPHGRDRHENMNGFTGSGPRSGRDVLDVPGGAPAIIGEPPE